MADEERLLPDEIELALERAYRRGFHQALTLLATFYPNGVSNAELTELANEQLLWRRELGTGGRLADRATARFTGAISPLERRHL
jgi:hypothetical protein